MNVTIIQIVIGAFYSLTKGLSKGLKNLEVVGTSEDHPNYSIIENGQNTEKSPGDLVCLLALNFRRETIS